MQTPTFARRSLWSMTILALAMRVSPALAQDDTAGQDPSVQQQIEAMRRELDRVQHDNRSMRGEIDTLRALNDEQWLTEQRANDIKALVHDVLADADTRASMQDSGMTAGWNEHFFLGSGDGQFLLIFEGLEQIRFILNHHDVEDRWRYGFENARTQLTFRGHVFGEDIEYLVRGEFARSGLQGETSGQETLLDAWARYVFTDKWALRFGQFKLPYSREFLMSDGHLQAVERTIVEEVLSNKRSQGIELQYADSVNRWSAALSDSGGGIFTVASVNTPWTTVDSEWSVTSRYERLMAGTWEQFSDFTSPRGDEFGLLLGFGITGQQGESTGIASGVPALRDEARVVGLTADVSAEWGGANVFASIYYTYFDSEFDTFNLIELYGATVQGGIYLAPKWEVFARGEYLTFDGDEFTQATNDIMIATVGVNYYLNGHDLKWTTDFSVAFNEVDGFFAPDITGFRPDSANADPQIVFRTQFQLLF